MTKQRSKGKQDIGKDSRRHSSRGEADKSDGRGSSANTVRETIESIVIAFVLAFLFRTFEAEAFVIPTGSMAPTLLGANKDVVCDECGYAYQAGASSENNDENNRGANVRDRGIVAATCPVCNYTMTVAPYRGEPNAEQKPTYSGDRILVDKISYQIGEPERWDVFVFKFPHESATNYIKRLVGLPNETLMIFRGDILVKKPGENDDAYRPARRSHLPRTLWAMLQTVHDNHYIPKTLVDGGWPRRWAPEKNEAAASWKAPPIQFADGRVGRQTFENDGSSQQDAWIRYRHLAPTFAQWQAIRGGAKVTLPRESFFGQLITDFYAYNTDVKREVAERDGTVEPDPQSFGMNWVGDLVVDCQVEVLQGGGELLLELVEGGQVFQCRINLENGQATLWIDGVKEALATASTDVKAPGSYHLALGNIDNEILLWVDDALVEFDTSTAYPSELDTSIPNRRDLEPAGIGGNNAKLVIRHVQVMRDIYYIAASGHDNTMWDMKKNPLRHGPATREGMRPMLLPGMQDLRDERLSFLSSPEQWGATPEGPSIFHDDNFRKAIFNNAEDEFMPMGDNSPMSLDGRIWPAASHTVHRDLLIGKALYIYWPHGWNIWFPHYQWPFFKKQPFWPNPRRMKFVR